MTRLASVPRGARAWPALLVALLLLTACGAPTPSGPRGLTKKTCADCHADFVKTVAAQRAHFPSLATRCEDCHDRHGLVGVNKLKKPEPALCIDCHADAAAMSGASNGHGNLPGGSCSACHDPHGSAAPALLTQQGNALCTTCHDAALFRPSVAHAPVLEDCLTCHDPHGTERNALKAELPDLCLTCHDAGQPAFGSAHQGYDVSQSNCSSCHAPHGSPVKGILAANVHAAMEDCTMCHAEVEPGAAPTRSPALRMDADALCADCHVQVQEDYLARAAHHAPIASGECTVCHNPHASRHEKLLVADSGRALCSQCHDTDAAIADHSLLGRSPHPPAAEGRCLDCHDPHGGGDARLLRRGETELCLSCHEGVKQDLGHRVVHATLEECSSCHAAHGSSQRPILRLPPGQLCLDCHADYAEKVRKEHVHAPLAQGQCTGCHDAHASEHDAVLKQPKQRLCLTCHADTVAMPAGGSAHAPVAKGECLDCHDPHSARDPGLLTKTGGELCSQCHGITQRDLDAAKVPHAPAKAGACLTCHTPHAAPRPKLLSLRPEALCQTCHPAVFDDLLKPENTAHAPAAQGKCLDCHTPHGGDHEGLTRMDSKSLCSSCHPLDTEAMRTKHLGLLADVDDCSACHAPHAAAGHGLFWPNRHAPFEQGNCKECHDE